MWPHVTAEMVLAALGACQAMLSPRENAVALAVVHCRGREGGVFDAPLWGTETSEVAIEVGEVISWIDKQAQQGPCITGPRDGGRTS